MDTSLRPATATTGLREPGHNCDEPCIGAASDPAACTCICGGRFHGRQRATHGPVRPDVAARRGRDLDRLFAASADLDEAF